MPPKRNNLDLLLEGNRLADHAWCPCRVSIRSIGLQTILNIQFVGLEDTDEDNILGANEARSRLRPLSTMLEKGQCLQLQEGDSVLSSRKLESGKLNFFEAHIKKILRQQHSSRVSCKCKFEIMWLDRNMKGDTCTVPASQIRRISQDSIHDHPVISEWLKCLTQEDGHQPEACGIGTDVQAQVKEEFEKIRDTSDENHFADESTPSCPAAGIEQTSQRKAHARHRSRAKVKLESIPEMAHESTSSSKQPQCSTAAVLEADTKPASTFPLDHWPKPRAARLAAVHPACATKMQAENNTGSATSHLESRLLVGKYDPGSIDTNPTQRNAAIEAEEQGKKDTSHRAGIKRGRSHLSPSLPFPQPNELLPIQGASLGNQFEFSVDDLNVNGVVNPCIDSLDVIVLQERTNCIPKADEPKYVPQKDTTQLTVKSRIKNKISSVRSSSRLRKETNAESHKKIQSSPEMTNDESIQPKAETERSGSEEIILSGSNRIKKSAFAQKSRLNFGSQANGTVQEQSDVLAAEGTERRAGTDITVAGNELHEEKKNGSRKRKQTRITHVTKKPKIVEADVKEELLEKEQANTKEELSVPAALMDVTLELTTDIHDNSKNLSPHRLEVRTRRVSFDSLPVRFGLGITGWPRSPEEKLASPSPSEAHLETCNVVDLEAVTVNYEIIKTEQACPSPAVAHSETMNVRDLQKKADALNHEIKQKGQEKGKKQGRKKAAPSSSSSDTSKDIVQVGNMKEKENVAPKVEEAASAKSRVAIVVSDQNQECMGGASGIAPLKTRSGKRGRAASAAVILSMQEGERKEALETAQKLPQRSSSRLKRTRT